MRLAEVVALVDQECRQQDVRMLGPQKASRLAELVRAHSPDLVVEVGTAIGYSGLWITDVLREQGRGRLVTFDQDSVRAAEARRNFQRAEVEGLVTQYVGDARELLRTVPPGPIDLLFLDGGFENYYFCLTACRARLRPGALLVADNAGVGAAEMADYLDFVRTNGASRTEWFDTDLPWNRRDAMEISTLRVT